MPNLKDYTVGWISARRTEYVAAQAFLDEEHKQPEGIPLNDDTKYTFGKFWKHYVVIALLPERGSGISSAAIVATHMRHSFPNLILGLMVGIGGGVPSERRDVRLGDIAVSVPQHGEGGVFQYDLGITIQSKAFQTTGFLNQPPMVLLTAVDELRAQYEIEGHRLEEAIHNVLEKNSRLRRNYQRPDPVSDMLFRSDILHEESKILYEGSCARICGDGPFRAIERRIRDEDEDNPAIHYGLIASANTLMRDAVVRDQLAAEKDVLCFDTEAAGVMNHFPCLVIRGICNYSDSHSYRQWEGYAAMAAAAYAKDLLRRIRPSRVESEKTISSIMSGPSKETSVISLTDSMREYNPRVNNQPPSTITPRVNDQPSSTITPRVNDQPSSTNTPHVNDQPSSTITSKPLELSDHDKEESDLALANWTDEVFDSPFVHVVEGFHKASRDSDTWFNEWMAKAESFVSQFRRNPPRPDEIVKIAIIDTGINLDHPLLRPYENQHQLSPGFFRNFITDQQSPVYDSTGHGTHCAHVILKTCPKARVFVAKAFDSDKANEFTAGHVRNAIEYCINTWKVDIISMAFSFSDYQKDIHDVIRQASVSLKNGRTRSVLFFAAASNNRHNQDNPVGFPARLDEVITVSSCRHNGERSEFSPPPVSDTFAVPGEVVKAAFPRNLDGNVLEKRLSGTSVATAILVGIAGLVLEYAKLKARTSQAISFPERLWYNQGMKEVFMECMTPKRTHAAGEYYVVKPWLLFSRKNNDFEVTKQISRALYNSLG